MPDDVAASINESQDETNRGVARATSVLALGNVISRVLGLGREVVLTNLFGATAGVDAFKVAILIPKSIVGIECNRNGSWTFTTPRSRINISTQGSCIVGYSII